MPKFSLGQSGRSLQLLLLTLVAIAAFYARTGLGPFQETMRVALAMSDNQMALLQGPPLALGFVIGIPIGILIDRHSRVRLVLVFVLLGIFATALTAWASAFSMLFAARCLIGVSACTIWTAVLSLLADWYPPEQRGRVTTVVSVGAVVGMSAAFGLGGGWIALSGPSGWRWAMLGQGLPLLIVLVAVLAIREPARTRLTDEKRNLGHVYVELWRYRARVLPLLMGCALLAGIADGAAVIWATPTLTRSFELAPQRAGAIMALSLLIAGIVGPILGGALADFGQRTGGPHRTAGLMTGVLVLSIPTTLFALAPGTVSASVLLTLFLTLGTAFSVAIMPLATIVIPSELRASCLSLMAGVSATFGFAVAPLMVSQLSVALGGETMIDKSLAMVCVTFSLLSVFAFSIGRRGFRGIPIQPEAVPQRL